MNHKQKGVFRTYTMLLPNLTLFLVISVYPVLWALQYMLFDFNGIEEKQFVGVQNFVRLFTRDPNYWNSVGNTFIYAGGKILLIIPLAFLVAVLINNPNRLYGGVQAIVFSPTIMSSAVMALVFYLLFNVYNGEINRMLTDAGIVNTPVNWLGKEYAMLTVVLVAVWGGLGNYMVYFLAGLQQIDTCVYESAEIDGVTSWQRMYFITIPMLGPVLKTILMLAILSGFQDYQSIMVLTEGGPFGATEVMFLNLYKLYYPTADMYSFRPQYGYGAAVSIITALIVGAVTILFLRLSKKLDEIY